MNKSEALRIIRKVRVVSQADLPADKLRDALDIAIEALMENGDVAQSLTREVRYGLHEMQRDTVSRGFVTRNQKAAIAWIERYAGNCTVCNGTGDYVGPVNKIRTAGACMACSGTGRSIYTSNKVPPPQKNKPPPQKKEVVPDTNVTCGECRHEWAAHFEEGEKIDVDWLPQGVGPDECEATQAGCQHIIDSTGTMTCSCKRTLRSAGYAWLQVAP